MLSLIVISKWNEEKHISEIPFFVEDFKSCRKDDKEWTKIDIVNLTSCLSLGLSGHKSNYTTKDAIDQGLLAFPGPSLLVAVCAHRSYPSRDKTQLPSPLPFFWIWKPVTAMRVCAFIPSNFRGLLQRQKGNSLYLDSLFLSPSASPPPQRG